MSIRLTKNGIQKKVATGYSWKSLFFGCLYAIARGDSKGFILQLGLAIITLGVNWAYSDKAHFHIESALMRQQLDVNGRVGSQTFDITRLGGKYNFYKDLVLNAALEHRNALKSETGYKLALETTNTKYALFSAGYLSVGNNQSMFFTLISKF